MMSIVSRDRRWHEHSAADFACRVEADSLRDKYPWNWQPSFEIETVTTVILVFRSFSRHLE